MSTPHDHHFIPAFYLGQWCGDPTDDSSKLIEYSIPYARKLVAKPVGRRATGFERDLYAFTELPPDQKQFVEQVFFDYADRMAADALQMLLIGNNRWTSETASAWARFIVGVHMRHPDAIQEVRSGLRQAWQNNGDKMQRGYELIRKPELPPTFAEHIAQTDPLAPVKAEVNALIKLLDNPIVGGQILKMKWDVIDVGSASHSLLTSDRPVILSKIEDPKDGSILLPISPTKFFVAVNNVPHLSVLKAARPRDLVSTLNKSIVGRARRYVWARDTSQESFVKKYMSTAMESRPFFPVAFGKQARWPE